MIKIVDKKLELCRELSKCWLDRSTPRGVAETLIEPPNLLKRQAGRRARVDHSKKHVLAADPPRINISLEHHRYMHVDPSKIQS